MAHRSARGGSFMPAPVSAEQRSQSHSSAFPSPARQSRSETYRAVRGIQSRRRAPSLQWTVRDKPAGAATQPEATARRVLAPVGPAPRLAAGVAPRTGGERATAGPRGRPSTRPAAAPVRLGLLRREPAAARPRAGTGERGWRKARFPQTAPGTALAVPWSSASLALRFHAAAPRPFLCPPVFIAQTPWTLGVERKASREGSKKGRTVNGLAGAQP